MKLMQTALAAALFSALPALAADLTVSQKNQTFSSPTMTVHLGDVIHFENLDTVTHNITVKGGGDDDDADDLGLQKPGQVVTHKFDAKGSFRVVCSIHPRMRMTVAVQ